MSQTFTLHYYFDPFCGWCYGAAPLLSQATLLANELAQQGTELTIRLHPGGMFSQPNCLPVSARFRAMASHHDARIAELTGQAFGPAYQQELLYDTTRILNSTPPCAAVLAAESLAEKGPEILHRLQRAHYIEGLDITAESVLLQQASKMLPDTQAFRQRLSAITSGISERFIHCHRQMQRFQLQGFPGFVLETAPDSASEDTQSVPRFRVIHHQPFYGQPVAFAEHLKSKLIVQED